MSLGLRLDDFKKIL